MPPPVREPPRDEGRVAVAGVAGIAIEARAGDLGSWRRTNSRFVAILRRHLLSWRALSARAKETLFDEGRQLLAGGATVT